MRLRALNNAELTYCTNAHAAESLAELRTLVATEVAEVKRQVLPDSTFGVGLRLPAAAAYELEDAAALESFAGLLAQQGLYVFTLNGSAYATRVKEQAYRPDFLEAERLRYTRSLAQVLARLLPQGLEGSISTVAGALRPRSQSEPDSSERIARHLGELAASLVGIEQQLGKTIRLALEPEPHCFLASAEETVEFFEASLFGGAGVAALREATGLSHTAAERALRHHVGVCLDACHVAVEFESPLEVYRRLQRAGIHVPKLQLSTGITLTHGTNERRRALQAFANDVYLHQTVVQAEGQRLRFADLPAALAADLPENSEWRVNFHVPIFMRQLGLFESTQGELLPLLVALRDEVRCPHLEVETFTWNVLPARLRDTPLTEAIARELRFALRALGLGEEPSPTDSSESR